MYVCYNTYRQTANSKETVSFPGPAVPFPMKFVGIQQHTISKERSGMLGIWKTDPTEKRSHAGFSWNDLPNDARIVDKCEATLDPW